MKRNTQIAAVAFGLIAAIALALSPVNLGNASAEELNGQERLVTSADGDLELSGSGSIVVGSSVQGQTITLAGVDLEGDGTKAPIAVQVGADVTFVLSGENAVSSTGEYAAINVPEGAEVTFSGGGSLSIVVGAESSAAFGAGIGGNNKEKSGVIGIKSGTIEINVFGVSAGIGGGAQADGGETTISGGDVRITVVGADGVSGAGTGIGGGADNGANEKGGAAGTIVISGGTVDASVVSASATSGSGAAIGSGQGKGGAVEITGGIVNVYVLGQASAIGMGGATFATPFFGETESRMKVHIGGTAQVSAKSDPDPDNDTSGGAAIGSTMETLHGCDVLIDGNAIVEACSTGLGAAIGAGLDYPVADYAKDVTVTICGNADVTAYATGCGAGIGSGFWWDPFGGSFDNHTDTAITIGDHATVSAYGGYGAAGIGGGWGDDAYQIDISGDATVLAVGGADMSGTGASGIGGGAGQDGDMTSGGVISIASTADIEAYATGTRYAIDLQGSTISCAAGLINGIFAEGELGEGAENVVTLFRNGEDVETTTAEGGCRERDLTLPVGYRAFASTTEGASDAYWVQNASERTEFATWAEGEVRHARFDVDGTILSQDGLVWDSAPRIGIETLTIYTGGNSENGDYVEDNTGDAGFPLPMFTGLDEVTEFGAEGWAPTEESGHPLVVNYYDEKTGERISDDSVPGVYDARIELCEEVVGVVVTADEIPIVDFADDDAKLNIRYTSDDEAAKGGELTTPVLSEEPTEPVRDAAVAVVPATSLIYLNGNEDLASVSASEREGLALLFDDLLAYGVGSDEEITPADNAALLMAHAQESGFDVEGRETQIKYLDLVDSADGNAWVSSSEGADVYWPYPEGTDETTEFQLLHLTGLHRDYFGDLSTVERIEESEVEEVQIEKTDVGIKFHIEESGFSPFILAWAASTEPDDPTPMPTTGSLRLEKAITGDLASPEDEFVFTVTLSGTSAADGTRTYGDVTFTDGVAVVTLRGGQSVTLSDIPLGTRYVVEETDANGYELVSSTGSSGTISVSIAVASFVNDKSEPGSLAPTEAINPGGSKVLLGSDGMSLELRGGEFTFRLTAIDGAPMPEGSVDGSVTTTNSAEGAIVFGDIVFTEAGTYRYVMTEVAGDDEGIAYDFSSHELVVAVSEEDVDGDGRLDIASMTYDGGTELPTFTNEAKGNAVDPGSPDPGFPDPGTSVTPSESALPDTGESARTGLLVALCVGGAILACALMMKRGCPFNMS